MKKIALCLVIIMSFSILVSCNIFRLNTYNPDEIHYSIDEGSKIETLSTDMQAKIYNYAEDCKIFCINDYKNLINNKSFEELDPYIAITDTYVYDFSAIDTETTNTEDLKVIEMLQKLRRDKSLPVMYVEFFGYVSYYPGFQGLMLMPLQVLQNIGGYFIFGDETVISLPYRMMCATNYNYELPDGTVIINCGDAHSEELKGITVEWYNKTPTALKLYE